MLRSSHSTLPVLAISALLCVACSPDSDETSTGSGGASSVSVTSVSVVTSTSSTGGAGGCSFTGIDVRNELTTEQPNGLVHRGTGGVAQGSVLISIEMVYNLGANDQPHVFTDWQNYEICHTCVIMGRACAGTACEVIFEVQSGTLEITNNNGPELGPFSGSLTDAEAVEVTIDPVSLEATPVEGGHHWCIPSYTFDVTTVSP